MSFISFFSHFQINISVPEIFICPHIRYISTLGGYPLAAFLTASNQEDSHQFAALSLDPEELRLSAKKSFNVNWDPSLLGDEILARQLLYVGIFDGYVPPCNLDRTTLNIWIFGSKFDSTLSLSLHTTVTVDLLCRSIYINTSMAWWKLLSLRKSQRLLHG